MEEEKTVKYKPASIRDLMRYASGLDWFLLVCGLSFGVLNGILGPFILIINLKLVGSLLRAQVQFDSATGIDLETFTHEMLEACLQYFLVGASFFITGFIGRQIRSIQQKFLIHVLNQEMNWLDQHQTGALIEKVSAYMDRIKDGTGEKIIVLLQGVFNIIAGLFVAFGMNWKLAAVTSVVAPPIIIALWASTYASDKMIRQERDAFSEASSIAEQVLHAVQTVLAFNAQQFEIKQFKRHLDDGCRTGVKKSVYMALFLGLYKFILFSSMGLSFWYGTTLVLNGEMKPEVVMAIYWTIIVGAMRIGFSMPNVNSIIGARLAAGELFSIIDRKPEMDCAASSGERPETVEGNLQFQNIHFNYPSRADIKVLEDVSFNVEAGQKIALVGHSGCGKSTSISLLMRFYDPEQGCITLDGRPIKDLNVEWLRSTIGIVSQEPIVFSGTIEDNLRMGKEDLTVAEMESACRMANAEEFIKKLPKGYQTPIGDGNIRLSGGQKQRLAIARALIRNPKILLLDEATSALDHDSEVLVQKGLEQASAGRTTIIIAHRLSTIKHVDRIFVFESGKIVEQGSHAELMKVEDGVYRRLVLAQAIDQLDEEDSSEDEDSERTDEKPQSRNSDTYKMSSNSLNYQKGWQADSDHFISQSLMNGKDENGAVVDLDSKLTPKPEKTDKVKPATYYQIFKYAKKERKFALLGILSAMFDGAAWPWYTILYGLLFKTLSGTIGNSTESEHENTRNGLLFLGLGVYVTKKMRIDVFRNILRQDGKFFDQPEHATGKLVARLVTDAPNVQAAIDERLSHILQAFCTLVYGCLMAFYFDWRMTLIEIVIVGLICGIQLLMLEVLKRRTMRDAQLGEESIRIATEAISQIRTVQALCRQRHFYKEFCKASKLPYKRAFWSAPVQAAVFGLGSCCEEINFVLTYLAGLVMIRAGYTSPFLVFQVIECINIGLLVCGIPLAGFIPTYSQALASAGLMFRMMRQQPEIDSTSTHGKRLAIEGEIKLDQVEFSYPRAPDHKVLHGLSLTANTAKTLALCGPSGCGKSTIVSLIERFYDVHRGRILLDNSNIKEINLPHMRSQIAIVGQEPKLFNLTLRENIAYGIEKTSVEEVIEAAKQANIHEFITSLPNGYETSIGPRGTQLSGGQRQRLSIARAIVRNPKILLLDEATASLDSASEKLVQESLERASHNKTCIIIAHRLSTIQHADLIVVLKDGRIVEQGSHLELMTAKGVYQRLVQKQTLTT
ncbi:Multidrug resistance protein pgp-3 [Aphelenchoides bicaudatus]|nr:Multidrug resistance protein pgp-3 [Aphelenchoides bicaudatus]